MGRGVIDGQGASFEGEYKVRPYILRMIECSDVTVKDITYRNSPMWVQHYLACEDVTIDGISVHSKVNSNNDGINIDSCSKVRISNCEINSGDDAIVLKSTSNRVCNNVTVTNCVLSTNCNALKLGTESNGGFENITINNCTIYDTRLAGIALELVDGGTFDRVTVSNIVMKNVGAAIFVRLGNRARPFKKDMAKPGMGSMRNIIISNVQAVGVDRTGCSITGLPGFPVENVTVENVRIRFRGGGTKNAAGRKVPELPEAYPEYKMFGILPAYGFYVRHAKNVRFHHIDLGFEEDDERPALVCDDVTDLDIQDLDAESTPSAEALIWLKQVDGAFIHGCRPRDTVTTFVRVEGEGSNDISLMNNDVSGVGHVLEKGEGVGDNAVYIRNNRTK
jgi:polygalacturonase